ncbi:MAG: DUF427 domain-containing protein [Actinomycetota bacterium]
MATATFNGVVIAESDDIEIVEGNLYFPIDALDRQYVDDSDHSTHCPWKGDASYWNLQVGDERATNAAWYYVTPKDGAEAVAGRVAFYPVVTVES